MHLLSCRSILSEVFHCEKVSREPLLSEVFHCEKVSREPLLSEVFHCEKVSREPLLSEVFHCEKVSREPLLSEVFHVKHKLTEFDKRVWVGDHGAASIRLIRYQIKWYNIDALSRAWESPRGGLLVSNIFVGKILRKIALENAGTDLDAQAPF